MMLKYQTVEETVQHIVDKHKQDPNVLGVLWFGSTSRGEGDKYSDIDIYVLLKKSGKHSRHNHVVMVGKQLMRVDIIFESLSVAINDLRDETKNVKRIGSQMLAGGVIVYDKNGALRKTQQLAQKNLKTLTKKDNDAVLMHQYSIDDFWGEVQRDFSDKNHIAFGVDSQLLITNIIELVLRANRSFWVQPRYLWGKLSKSDKRAGDLINRFYQARTASEQLKILGLLVAHVSKSYGSLPDNWQIS